jgi:hypothetical protein
LEDKKQVNKIFRNIIPTVGLSCAFFMTIPMASASVVGTLLTGSSGTVTATIDSITFSPDSSATGGTNFACPSAECDSDVASGTTLTFANGPALTTREGIDVNSPISASSIGEADFLTFSNDANLVFSLGSLFTYTNTNCAALTSGDSCVVFSGSPLLLTCIGGSPSTPGCVGGETVVSLTITGTVTDGSGTPSTYIGGFSQTLSTPLPNGTAPTPVDIQSYFCPGGVCSTTASITSSQSGSFTATLGSTTPEPSSMVMLLMGGGLIAIALHRRRQTR